MKATETAIFTLDHNERLYLRLMVGYHAIPGGHRQAWKLQDKLIDESSEDYRKAEVRITPLPAGENTDWNHTALINPVEIEFSRAELLRIKYAVDAFAVPPGWRSWLEPILDRIESLLEE